MGVGPDVVPDLRRRRHHIRLTAAVGDNVVDAVGFLGVLAEVVGADVHQFDAVQGAAALVRTAGGVGGQAGEGEFGRNECLRAAVLDAILGARVPVQAGVEI